MEPYDNPAIPSHCGMLIHLYTWGVMRIWLYGSFNQVSELDLHANGDGAHYREMSAIIHQSEWGAQVVLHLHGMGSMINSRLTPVKNSNCTFREHVEEDVCKRLAFVPCK